MGTNAREWQRLESCDLDVDQDHGEEVSKGLCSHMKDIVDH